MNINLDQKTLEACLKTITNLGSTTYLNICTNQTSVVPWGLGEWVVGMIVLSLLVFSFVVAILIVIMGIDVVRS